MKKFLSLTMLSVVLLTACTPSGEDLQGKFGGTGSATVTMTLSPSSPSGAKTVSTNDNVLAFDLKASSRTTLPAGSTFLVTFDTDNDLDPASSGLTLVNLMVDGKTVGVGTFNLVDITKTAQGTAYVTTTSVVNLTSKAKTFTVSTDTETMLVDDSGIDDPLATSVEFNGNIVKGSMLLY